MGCLENIFSKENIKKYSEACLDLAVQIPESRKNWKHRNFDTLIIPSRGAFPFFLGMVYSLDKLKKFEGVQEEFYNNLGAQNTINSLLPKNLELKGKDIRTLLIPFTADLNISKIYPDQNNDEFIYKTRKYWANVTKSFSLEPSEREKDPYFRAFTDLILRDIEGKEELAKEYECFPRAKGFSIIDTVISGRASNDILKSFDELIEDPKLVPSASLIIDENGEKLKSKYSQYLYSKVPKLVDIHYIPRIVSEDKGASFLGVAAVIYPSIMKQSLNSRYNGKEFFIGAGSWHKSSDLGGDYSENFKFFMEMIYRGIDLSFEKNYESKGEKSLYKAREKFEESRESFLEREDEIKALKKSENIDVLNLTRNYSYEGGCYETSSRVFHAPFTEKSEERAINHILSLPGIRYSKRVKGNTLALNPA